MCQPPPFSSPFLAIHSGVVYYKVADVERAVFRVENITVAVSNLAQVQRRRAL